MVDTTVEPAICIPEMEYGSYLAVFGVVCLAVSRYYAILRAVSGKCELPSPPPFLYLSLMGRTLGELSWTRNRLVLC